MGLIFIALVSPAGAQDAVTSEDGETVAYRMFVNPSGPCAVIFPQGLRKKEDLFTLGEKFNHLGANALIIPPSTRYSDPWATADDLLKAVGDALSLAKKQGDGALFVVAEQKMAAMALIAGTKDFRIKGIIAVSPGEYFPDREFVHRRIKKLRIPTLVLYSPFEERVVKHLLSDVPKQLVIYSGVLKRMGYTNLLGTGKLSGKSWLAISLFYHQNFAPATSQQ